MPSLEELASKAAGQDQIDRAKVYCAGDGELEAQLAAFIETKPTRGQMVIFLEQLGFQFQRAANRRNALAICESLGIENPTNSELLLAHKTVVLSDALLKNQRQTMAAFKKLGIQIDDAPGVLTGALVGAVVAKIL